MSHRTCQTNLQQSLASGWPEYGTRSFDTRLDGVCHGAVHSLCQIGLMQMSRGQRGSRSWERTSVHYLSTLDHPSGHKSLPGMAMRHNAGAILPNPTLCIAFSFQLRKTTHVDFVAEGSQGDVWEFARLVDLAKLGCLSGGNSAESTDCGECKSKVWLSATSSGGSCKSSLDIPPYPP